MESKIAFNTKTPTYKVVITGDSSAGKTAWMHALNSESYETKHTPTVYTNIYKIAFKTSQGPIILTFWDTAGIKKFQGVRDGYYAQSDAAVFFYDVTAKNQVPSMTSYYIDVTAVIGKTCPMVCVGNKIDLKNDALSLNESLFASMKHIRMSVKSNTRVVDPVLYLLRELTGDSKLTLT